MKQKYLLILLFFAFAGLIHSCSSDEDALYDDISEGSSKQATVQNNAPITIDLSQVPFPKLSDYRFFDGPIHNQKPNYKVLPYKPASDLFTDYAKKKRFVWMPKGTSASYNGADNVFVFPVGAVLIKTFYYDNVQPSNTTKIIETRLLVKTQEATPTDSGWKLYEYIWNEEQTEAYLDTNGNGSFVPVTFTENNVTKSVDYRIPSATECATCHKINPADKGDIIIPIGPKPQNLNFTYDYVGSSANQLERWKKMGYIGSALPDLATIASTVDWKDTSKPLETRAKSYLDANCAHCHRDGGHCAYVPMRLNFSNTNMNTFGACMVPFSQTQSGSFVIYTGRASLSEIVLRMNTNQESIKMPLIGRTTIHNEGLQLVTDWINSMRGSCP